MKMNVQFKLMTYKLNLAMVVHIYNPSTPEVGRRIISSARPAGLMIIKSYTEYQPGFHQTICK